MRVLALDSGAKRCGIAVLDFYKGKPTYIFSEIFGIERDNGEAYQGYRLRIMEAFSRRAKELLDRYGPDVVVSEIVPVSGSAISSAQRQLAATAATAFQSSAMFMGIRCDQIAANSVKKKLTGSGRATKTVVRKAVLTALPDLKERLLTNKAISDESDAIAVALVYGNEREKVTN